MRCAACWSSVSTSAALVVVPNNTPLGTLAINITSFVGALHEVGALPIPPKPLVESEEVAS